VSFEAFMAVTFHVEFFWIVTLCTAMVGYPWPWRWRQHGALKRWYPTTAPHGVTTPKDLGL